MLGGWCRGLVQALIRGGEALGKRHSHKHKEALEHHSATSLSTSLALALCSLALWLEQGVRHHGSASPAARALRIQPRSNGELLQDGRRCAGSRWSSRAAAKGRATLLRLPEPTPKPIGPHRGHGVAWQPARQRRGLGGAHRALGFAPPSAGCGRPRRSPAHRLRALADASVIMPSSPPLRA